MQLTPQSFWKTLGSALGLDAKGYSVAAVSLLPYLPVVVVLMMIIVGTDIAPGQMGASATMPRVLLGATLGQMLLPLIALLLVWLLSPSLAVAGGLLLVAVSPGGGMSNYYCALARLNVALSVTLTAISGFIALATMPVLFATIVPAALGVQAFGVPVVEMMTRLLLFLVLPVATGMVLRRLFPAMIERAGAAIRGFGLVLLLVFLTLIFIEERQAVIAMFDEAVTVIVAFTLLALLAGWTTARALRMDRPDRAVVAVEFATRNMGISALLALTTLQQPEFAAFGALCLLFQSPILLLGVFSSSRHGARLGKLMKTR